MNWMEKIIEVRSDPFGEQGEFAYVRDECSDGNECYLGFGSFTGNPTYK